MLRQQLLLNMAMIGFVHGRTIAVFLSLLFYDTIISYCFTIIIQAMLMTIQINNHRKIRFISK